MKYNVSFLFFPVNSQFIDGVLQVLQTKSFFPEFNSSNPPYYMYNLHCIQPLGKELIQLGNAALRYYGDEVTGLETGLVAGLVAGPTGSITVICPMWRRLEKLLLRVLM